MGQNQEKRRIKEDMNNYADQYARRSLLKKVLKLLKNQQQESVVEQSASKLYPVFQAWKFHVKESKLLQKYLAESNDNNN